MWDPGGVSVKKERSEIIYAKTSLLITGAPCKFSD